MKKMKWSVIGLLAGVAATSLYAPSASAHGEKSQAAFMRMRTIHWIDLSWSKERVNVNDFVEVKGKFHVFEGWPETVAEPDDAFLNIGIPGPVFIRKESYIGGQLVPRSVKLDIGKTYDFRVLLKARRPGDWHVHTMINVQGGGPIIGPGKWISIDGSMGDFRNPVTTHACCRHVAAKRAGSRFFSIRLVIPTSTLISTATSAEITPIPAPTPASPPAPGNSRFGNRGFGSA